MVKVPPWHCPSSAPVPPHGPRSSQPQPRVLELAASRAADVPALDHPCGSEDKADPSPSPSPSPNPNPNPNPTPDQVAARTRRRRRRSAASL